jgi:sugar lactone lactonase YvrE
MKKLFPTILLLIISIGVFISPAQAQWTNGQNASLVIGQPIFTSSASGTSDTTLLNPNDVAVDATHGKLYVVDGYNNRILRFAYPVSGNQPAAELVFGQLNFNSNGIGTSRDTFDGPRGIAVDQTGRLWVSDLGNNRVLWFNQAHTLGANQPNADGVLGQLDFDSKGCAVSPSGICEPYGIAISSNNTLFVTDASNNRVLRFDNAPGKANGANADGVLGQPDFTSNGNAVTRNGMDNPRGVALQDTTLYVADNNNARVLRFDNAPGKNPGADADGVLGQPDFFTKAPSLTQNGMVLPGRLAVDLGGRLYVSEGLGANRVLIFSNAATKPNGDPADFVLGQLDFSSSNPATAQNRLRLDSAGGGLAVDYGNNLLAVSDDSNNRVMIFQANFPAIVLNPANLTFNTTQGVNPAEKTINLSNGGEGTLDWTASVEAGVPAWLSVNPASGTGNATLTVSVNSAGLAPGNYTKTITVTAPGATNTPQTVTISLTIDPNRLYIPLLQKNP